MHPRRTAFARSKHKYAGGYWMPPPSTSPPHTSANATPDSPPSSAHEPPSPSPSSSSSSDPPLLTNEYLPGASEATMAVWFWDLHPTEKKDILTVTHDELLTALSQSTEIELAYEHLIVAAVLEDKEYVTSIRRAFVNALHHEALIEPATIAPCTAVPIPTEALATALHPVSRCMLDIMTDHLHNAHHKKRAIIRLTTLAVFYLLYIAQLTSLIRYPLALALLPVLYIVSAQTAGPVSAPDPLPLLRSCQRAIAIAVLSLFDDSVVRESVETCCVWLLLISWSGHYSPRYYTFLCCVAALPLLLLCVYSVYKSRAIMWPIRVMFLFGSLYVLYLSWYSYSTFLFTILFFFPSAATVAVSSVVFVTAAAFPLLLFGQSYLYTFLANPILYSALYILSVLFSLYYYFFSPSYLLLTLALLSSTLFLPPLLGGGLSLALTFLGQLLATHGLLRLITLCGELVLLLVLAGTVVVLDWLLRRVVVWLDKRGWLGGRVGRWWAVVLRWCMESKAVKSFRDWLRQKAESASTASDGSSAREGEG